MRAQPLRTPQQPRHSLDTGRLNPETYRLFDSVEKHYGIRIEYTFPDTQEVVDLVREKGMFSFYEDGHGECCRVRKVRPLRKQLTTLKAWITGQRKDQSPGACWCPAIARPNTCVPAGTRAAVPVVQVDPVFEGVTGGAGSLIKYNPLSNITSAEVWNFLRVMVRASYELTRCAQRNCTGRANKRAARLRVHLHRLRALHPRGAAQPARA